VKNCTRFRRAAMMAILPAIMMSFLGVTGNPAMASSSVKRVNPNGTLIKNNKLLRAPIDKAVKVFKTCDLNASREAFHTLESTWNAIEGYIQFMSVERYNFFEHVYLEDQIAAGLGLDGGPLMSCADRVAAAKKMDAAWEEIIRFEKRSADPGKLFDDVATLRMINQGIRLARAAIDGNPAASPMTPSELVDPAGAKAAWNTFVAKYPTARALINFRNPALASQLDGLVANVNAAFAAASPYPAASAALAAIAPRYNLGSTLVNAAARNVIRTRKVFNQGALEHVGTVGDILTGLQDMRDDVALGTPAGATAAQNTYTSTIQSSLSFKTGGPLTHADVVLTTAVNNYVAAQTPATANALLDQINVAEQVFVGQFWGTPALNAFLSSL
jgi:hypothetical protein